MKWDWYQNINVVNSNVYVIDLATDVAEKACIQWAGRYISFFVFSQKKLQKEE